MEIVKAHQHLLERLADLSAPSGHFSEKTLRAALGAAGITSPSTVKRHIAILEGNGWLKWHPDGCYFTLGRVTPSPPPPSAASGTMTEEVTGQW